jgi:hypothetical protein
VAGTYTSRTGKLYKPAAGDDVNVTTDINNNMDNLDTYAMGFVEVANSSARPTTVWPGLCIFQQDDDTTWVSNGSSPASASWINIPNGTTAGSTNVSVAGTGSAGITVNVTGDSQKRFTIYGDGDLKWGSGSASPDTELVRQTAGELRTSDNFTVMKNVSVGGAPSVGAGVGVLGLKNATTAPTGNPSSGVIVYSNSDSRLVVRNPSGNNQLVQHSFAGDVVTDLVSNAAETTLLSVVVPANEIVNDGIYKLTLMGVLSCNASTTINMRSKVNGATMVGTGNYNLSSALTASPYRLETTMRFRSPGASSSLFAHQVVTSRWNNASPNTDALVLMDSMTSTAGSTIDTTAPVTFSITGDWGASSANNRLVVTAYWFERIV